MSCLLGGFFAVIGSMFGLGSRKVLKYSAIDTSFSIDVEDTVTCFCRSVFLAWQRAHTRARIREIASNVYAELSLPTDAIEDSARVCWIDWSRIKRWEILLIRDFYMGPGMHSETLREYVGVRCIHQ